MSFKYAIKHRFSGAVVFGAELAASLERESDGIRLGAAVKLAIKARADLAGADLAGADLAGADLAGADLARANLAGADLAGAYLAGADLARANLAGAYLAGAYLARANLAGANLAGADLAGAYDVIALGFPNYWPAFAWHRKGVLMGQVGCRCKSIEDGRAYWADKDDRREVMAALDYAETVARFRGWPIKAFKKDA